MKIFNVSIRVNISQIAEIGDLRDSDPPKKEPFNDDPLDKAAKLMDRYADRIMGPKQLYPPIHSGESDGQMMTENICIAAESFEELQSILAKFHAIAKELPAVPKSLLHEGSSQIFPPVY